DPPARLVLKRDGVEVDVATVGLDVALDPGEHVIVASAPDRIEWTGRVVLGPDADHQVVTVPKLALAPASTPTRAPVARSTEPAAPPSAASDGGRENKRRAGFAVGAAGAALLGVGTAFALMAAGDVRTAEDDPKLCSDKKCSPAGLDQIGTAEAKAH